MHCEKHDIAANTEIEQLVTQLAAARADAKECHAIHQDLGDGVADLAAQLNAERGKVEKLREALIWCGGSNDFAYPNGIARKGWEKTVIPLLADTKGSKG